MKNGKKYFSSTDDPDSVMDLDSYGSYPANRYKKSALLPQALIFDITYNSEDLLLQILEEVSDSDEDVVINNYLSQYSSEELYN